MPLKVDDVVKTLNNLAPFDTALQWDNVGLLVGEGNNIVNKILVSLDVTDEIIEQAISENVNLIVTHHPLIFKPIKNVTDKTPLGSKVIKLLKNNISLCSAHTNLDMSNNGTNDVLFDILELCNKQPLFPLNENFLSLGRIGYIKEQMYFYDYIQFIREKLNLNTVTFVGNNDLIKKVGICTGSASNPEYFLQAKKMDCHIYISGDLTYHNAQFADDINLKVIDATHFGTESITVPFLANYILEHLNEVEVIQGKEINVLKQA